MAGDFVKYDSHTVDVVSHENENHILQTHQPARIAWGNITTNDAIPLVVNYSQGAPYSNRSIQVSILGELAPQH